MIGEINLTPLMDLTFILLITFIITFPLLESGLPVSLPEAQGNPIEDQDNVTVTINGEGQWFVDKREVNKDQFVAELRYLKENRPDATILLRGDEDLPYGQLVEVMSLLKENGIQKISLVTRTGDGSGGA
ncbi:biopolymer transporter ExbD [Kiritimatiellota bacterium B12222]|nr:biopolymer transporter ExbD [Kiritimatiellota bacterium B12222]